MRIKKSLSLIRRKSQFRGQQSKVQNRRQLYFNQVALEIRSARTIAPAEETFIEFPMPNI